MNLPTGRNWLARTLGASALALAALASLTPAHAAWPEKPVTIVVGYPAGSITDLLARRVGTYIAAQTKQSVVVENRAGGGGIIGAEHVKKAPGDGYTLLVAPPSHVFSHVFRPQTPYHPINDFSPIAMLATTPLVLLVGKDVPVSNLKEYVAYAKGRSGGISIGNTGNGSASHVSAELLRMTTGVPLTVIPYRGGAPAANDLVGGQLPSLFYDVGSILPYVTEGKVKAIGVTSRKRSAIMPNVPTLMEEGATNFELDTWFALVGPARMPPAVVNELNRLTVAALRTPDTAAWLEARGLASDPGSAAHITEFLHNEVKKWNAFNQTAKIQME